MQPLPPKKSAFGNIELSPAALLMLALTLGPLGLPIFWQSKKYSVSTKWLISLGVVGVTLVLPLAIILYWLHFALQPLVDVFG